MRSSRPWLLSTLVALSLCTVERTATDAAGGQPAMAPPGASAVSGAEAQPATTPMTAELRTEILEAMRLNRRTFQEDAVLKRYAESRSPETLPALVSCELPRTASGAPAPQYPAEKARAKARPYAETKVADCLGTTGGLSGTRASPLVQHYYCSLPGVSPDIRGCFTFQLRLPSVSRTRSVWEEGFLSNGTPAPIQKTWNFLGPDPATVPDAATAFTYCATDGRPHSVNTLKNGKLSPLVVEDVFPEPTRPMCWIVQTQAEIFQGIMGGAINPPRADQVALLEEYYQCRAIKSKVSAARFKALCTFPR
jgi:hypothetical protein